MKRIVIFCDGTWSHADQAFETNVHKLRGLLTDWGEDKVRQVGFYFEGVGVNRDGPVLARLGEKVVGGATGWGLDRRIKEAYRALCHSYEPGDEVYIFGFSRGAYTARSLVGLIRNSGLPHRPGAALVDACFAHYRDRGLQTDATHRDSMRFRLKHSPEIMTVPEVERAFRAGEGVAPGRPFRIAYLGVWDTVGSLGVPAHWGLPAVLLNKRYRFHNNELGAMVASARHAVAIDERRRHFEPTLWSNLAELSRTAPPGAYRQEWFAGDHASVGGGGRNSGLSNIALVWIAAGAARAGLSFDTKAFDKVDGQCDLAAPLLARGEPPSLLDRVLRFGGQSRQGPERIDEVAHPAIRRWRLRDLSGVGGPAGRRDYRPHALRRLAAALDRFDINALTDYAMAVLMGRTPGPGR